MNIFSGLWNRHIAFYGRTSVRIGTLTHTFTLMNRPNFSPRIQALDSAALTPLKGTPTQESEELAAIVKNCAINPDLTSDQRITLLKVIPSFPMAFEHGSHQLGSCPDDAMVIKADIPKPIPAVKV
jgi:hypothetical protein